MAKAIADHNCFSIVGGGDTLPIIENLKLQNDIIVYLQGRSLLTYLEGGSFNNRQAKLKIMKKRTKIIATLGPHLPQPTK